MTPKPIEAPPAPSERTAPAAGSLPLGLVAALDGCVRVLAGLEMAGTSPGACEVLVASLARLERLCRLRKAQAALRAAAGSPGRGGPDGSPDAAHWLAQQSGESVGAAKAAIETLEALDGCPETRRALESGEVSLAQAKEIAAANHQSPGSEDELLELARRSALSTLRDEARKKRHQSISAGELHRRQGEARKFRWWRNEIGNIAFTGEVPPHRGVGFVNRLDAETDRLWRAAPRDGREPHERYAADAFVKLVDEGGTGKAGRADVVVVVDLRAWRRGHTEGDEVCHIIGGGTIPVPIARQLAVDAFFKAVVHDGQNILTLAHFGRKTSAELRSALELGTPPAFDGITCCEAGCGRKHGLEWDHINPVANNGPTSYTNLQPRCRPHHTQKTERDRANGLLHRREQGRSP